MRAIRRVLIAASIGWVASSAPASALHYVCELHGAAQFAPGLSATTTPLGGPLGFAFQGDLTNCQGDTGGGRHLCVVGELHAPSCAANITEGQQFVICAGDCISAPGGTAACSDPEVCEVVRAGYGDLVAYVERVSGLEATHVARFFAQGMLLNVFAAMGLVGGASEPWSERLLAACKDIR